MLFNSLGLSDVIELAVLCAIVFIPIGFFLCWYYEHINYVFKSKSFLKNNLICSLYRDVNKPRRRQLALSPRR